MSYYCIISNIIEKINTNIIKNEHNILEPFININQEILISV